MTLEEAIRILEDNDFTVYLNEDFKNTLGKALGIGAVAATAAFGNSGIGIHKAGPGNVPNDKAGFGNRVVHLQQRYNYDHDKYGVPTSYKLKDTKHVIDYSFKEEIELTKRKILATPDSMLRKFGREHVDEIAKLMVKTANKYNIDVDILLAMAGTESNFDNDARSSAGAVGMMQITKTAAYDSHTRLQNRSKWTFSFRSFNDLKTNIDNAGRIVADLSKRRNNVIEMILSTYNGGGGQATAWRAYAANTKYDRNGKVAPKLTTETKNYVERCLSLYKIYKGIQDRYNREKKKV